MNFIVSRRHHFNFGSVGVVRTTFFHVKFVILIVDLNRNIKMAFLTEMRNYFTMFICLGLWSSIPNPKHKLLLQIGSISSMAMTLWSFLFVFCFDRLYLFTAISNTVSNLLFLAFFVEHLIIILESKFKREVQSDIMEEFTLIDQLLNVKLRVPVPYKEKRREMFIENAIVLSILFLIHVQILAYLYYQNQISNLSYPSFYPTCIVRFKCLQVWFFICLMRNRLNLINNEIINVQHETSTSFKHSDQRQRVLTVGQPRLSSKLPTFERLMVLKQIYGELYEICELMRSSFGWSLLAIITHGSIDIACHFYWGYMVLHEFRSLVILGMSTLAFHSSSCFRSVSLTLN